MTPPPPRPPEDLATPLWQYALTLYRRAGVAPACLALQAQAGLDVCVLLFALYAHQQQRALSAAQLAQVDQGLQAWRTQVVLPLRQLRQAMKTGLAANGMTPAWSDWVREQVKTVELQAEQVALAYLDGQVAALPPQDAAVRDLGPRIERVLTHFLSLQQRPLSTLQAPEVQAAVQALTREAQAVQQGL